jgi:P-type conjugative transfer protein TrbJ
MKGLNVMRKLLLLGVGAIPLSMVHPAPSEGLIVECANCSDLADQLISDAKQAQQYLTQLQQYQTQLQQYQNMLQNTLQLPNEVYATVTADINQVRSIANAASLLTGNSGSIITRLSSAGAYASQATTLPTNIGQQFAMWQQTLGNASNALGRTLGLQQGQEATYAAQQAQIQAMNPTGQLQAIQQTNQLAALTSTQLNQLQTTVTAMAQEQATTDEINGERRAVADAYATQFLSAPYQSLTGYPTYK